MSERPRVSVVVPYYDSERHIAACVESLLGQVDVGGPFELIFVDNGSSDGSSSILERYPEVTVLDEPEPGAYAARNTGVDRVRAPMVAFTDADCAADPDWLRTLCERLRDPAVAIVLGHVRYPPEASLSLRLLGAYENAKTAYVLDRCPPANHFGYANNMAVRAEVFRAIGPFEVWPRAADTELIHRLARLRPDLRTVYAPSMRVTHLEFVSARKRARRLSLYTRTNAKIETFRELTARQRLGVLGHLRAGNGARGRE